MPTLSSRPLLAGCVAAAAVLLLIIPIRSLADATDERRQESDAAFGVHAFGGGTLRLVPALDSEDGAWSAPSTKHHQHLLLMTLNQEKPSEARPPMSSFVVHDAVNASGTALVEDARGLHEQFNQDADATETTTRFGILYVEKAAANDADRDGSASSDTGDKSKDFRMLSLNIKAVISMDDDATLRKYSAVVSPGSAAATEHQSTFAVLVEVLEMSSSGGDGGNAAVDADDASPMADHAVARTPFQFDFDAGSLLIDLLPSEEKVAEHKLVAQMLRESNSSQAAMMSGTGLPSTRGGFLHHTFATGELAYNVQTFVKAGASPGKYIKAQGVATLWVLGPISIPMYPFFIAACTASLIVCPICIQPNLFFCVV